MGSNYFWKKHSQFHAPLFSRKISLMFVQSDLDNFINIFFRKDFNPLWFQPVSNENVNEMRLLFCFEKYIRLKLKNSEKIEKYHVSNDVKVV